MPVVLEHDAALAWLDAAPLDPGAAVAILQPIASDAVDVRNVSNAVGNVRNDSPDLIEPVDAPREQPTLFDMRGER
jgi:putative SOS response-associated peptidase YedK